MPLGPIIPLGVNKQINQAVDLGILIKNVTNALGTKQVRVAKPSGQLKETKYDGNSSINKFISAIKGPSGIMFAKSTQFYVDIVSLPKSVQSSFEYANFASGAIRFLCSAVNIPGMVFSPTTVKDFSISGAGTTQIKRSAITDYEFADLNLVFYVDRDFQIKKFFDDIANGQINKKNFEVQYYSDYVFDVAIHVVTSNVKRVDGSGKPGPEDTQVEVYTITYHNCSIKSVQDIQMSWSDSPTPPLFTVSLGYETYTRADFSNSFADASINLFGKTLNEEYIEKVVAGGPVNVEALQDFSKYAELKKKTLDYISNTGNSLTDFGKKLSSQSFSNSLNISSLF